MCTYIELKKEECSFLMWVILILMADCALTKVVLYRVQAHEWVRIVNRTHTYTHARWILSKHFHRNSVILLLSMFWHYRHKQQREKKLLKIYLAFLWSYFFVSSFLSFSHVSLTSFPVSLIHKTCPYWLATRTRAKVMVVWHIQNSKD